MKRYAAFFEGKLQATFVDSKFIIPLEKVGYIVLRTI